MADEILKADVWELLRWRDGQTDNRGWQWSEKLDFCCFCGGAMIVDTINEDVKEKEVPDIG